MPFKPNGACTARTSTPNPCLQPTHIAPCDCDLAQVIHSQTELLDLTALVSAYPDTDDGAGDRYIMGYSLVPLEIMANFAAFPPWDAFDCAHKRGAAQRILAARATLNADRGAHLAAQQHLAAQPSTRRSAPSVC